MRFADFIATSRGRYQVDLLHFSGMSQRQKKEVASNGEMVAMVVIAHTLHQTVEHCQTPAPLWRWNMASAHYALLMSCGDEKLTD
ncbi:hypothetical protein KL918_000150 [Ogataea parapolymorpha]|nr:hypothetical protein KL918_000150 [Ogataea parapolymorpha]KAG7873234.1 hypothetical protein KL916_002535 [Ogataea parapolymorpha]